MKARKLKFPIVWPKIIWSGSVFCEYQIHCPIRESTKLINNLHFKDLEFEKRFLFRDRSNVPLWKRDTEEFIPFLINPFLKRPFRLDSYDCKG